MQVIFLGTNGWYDSDNGNTICSLFSSDKYHIISTPETATIRLNAIIKSKKIS
jgi:hypothetical protein